jgi:hypothetical protein
MKRSSEDHLSLSDVWHAIENSRITHANFDLCDIVNFITASKTTSRMLQPYLSDYFTVLLHASDKPSYTLKRTPFDSILVRAQVNIRTSTTYIFCGRDSSLLSAPDRPIKYCKNDIQALFKIIYPWIPSLSSEDVKHINSSYCNCTYER